MARHYEEIMQSLLDPENTQQKKTFGGTAVLSNAVGNGIKTVVLYATEACWVRFGSAPVAVANDGFSIFIPAENYRPFFIKENEKISVIQDSASGDLHITEGKLKP